MPRVRPEDSSAAGQDSFLDVVTNIVGILIILVMVVQGRVSQIVLTAAPESSARAESLGAEIEALEHKATVAESEIAEISAQGGMLVAAAAGAAEARLQVATAVAATRAELERRSRDVDAATAAAAEAAARRRQMEAEIERCTLEAQGVAHAPQTTQEVLAYPTPIGRTVNGHEIHFRLAEDRIAYVPLEELFELAKSNTRRHTGSIAEMASRIESVGPAQGFMLDYVIEAKVDQSRGQVLIRSREWVVRPTGPGQGETVEEALSPQSRFRRTLALVTPDTTVTLWCYPDSFEAYRRIREEMHRLGVATACRPMPDDAPIGGSSQGSKSVAQ
jgi:hypothetical protein